jgi:hypothetical protein
MLELFSDRKRTWPNHDVPNFAVDRHGNECKRNCEEGQQQQQIVSQGDRFVGSLTPGGWWQNTVMSYPWLWTHIPILVTYG